MKDCSCFGPNKFNMNKHKQTNKSTLPSYSRHDAWRIETFDKNILNAMVKSLRRLVITRHHCYIHNYLNSYSLH